MYINSNQYSLEYLSYLYDCLKLKFVFIKKGIKLILYFDFQNASHINWSSFPETNKKQVIKQIFYV
jgi:hypothetical protein